MEVTITNTPESQLTNELATKFAAMAYNKLLGVAEYNGFEGEDTKKESLVEFMVQFEIGKWKAEQASVKQKGRKIDPTSKRQLRLKEEEERRAAGLIQKGRPKDPNAPNNQRRTEIDGRRDENGIVRKGRPPIGAGNGKKREHTMEQVYAQLDKVTTRFDELLDMMSDEPEKAIEVMQKMKKQRDAIKSEVETENNNDETTDDAAVAAMIDAAEKAPVEV